MRWIALRGLVLFSSTLFTPEAWAQLTATPANPITATATTPRSAEADLVRGWYRDYLGREVGPELSAWIELLRGGMSPTDVQATILGSDEFYYQKGRDLQTFVRETLQSVNWAEPSFDELRRWTDRLTQLRGDRFALAREILLANGQPQTPASQAGDIVTRLNSAARLAIDTASFEIGGTPQGRQATLQAQSLQSAVDQLQRTIAISSNRPSDALLALDNAERAYQALQTTLNSPPGTAPSATGIVRRIGTMLTDARAMIRPTTTTPSIPSGANYGYSQQQLLDQVTSVKRAADSLIQMLTSQAYQNYAYSVVLRDLDTLSGRVAGFEQAARSGLSSDRLQWELQNLRDIADRIEPQLLAGRPPYFARLYWQSIQSSLEQLRETLGGTPPAVSGSSTVLRPTPLHTSLLPLVDQAASQIDVFLAGTNPLVFGIADVPGVQRDARNLKSRVLTLRQQAGAGEPAGVLKQTLSGMVDDYRDAFDRWNQIVASYRLINPARLSPIGETLNQVEQMINQALASGDLTPAGPTRAGQHLASLSGEVSDARRSLAGFASYREQQAVDLYLEQLSGYVQSINDALARTTTVDARRLAVGMQGVVGRMQTEIDSLNQRVATAGTRDQRQLAGDLQLRTSRIGKLVDDIETELY